MNRLESKYLKLLGIAVLTNSDLTYEAITAVYIASRVHANRRRGGSWLGRAAIKAPGELCILGMRAEPIPTAKCRRRIPAPCAGRSG